MIKHLKILFVFFFITALSGCNPNKKENDFPEEDQHFQNPLNPRLNAINDALEDDPDNPDYYYKRALILLEDKNLRLSLNDINSAIQLDNTNPNYYILQANIYRAMNKNTEALKVAKQAEAMNSSNAELFILLAHLYFDSGDKKNSEYYLNQSEILAPLHSEIFVLKGNVFAQKGDTLQAIRQYMTALEKDKENLDAFKALASIYDAKRRYDSSMVFVVKGKAIANNEPEFDFLHGKVLEHVNMVEAAKTAHFLAINKDSTFYQSGISLGNIYYKANKITEALRWYNFALTINNDLLVPNLKVAEILETLNRGEEAIPYYERAALMDTANPKLNANLKKLYLLYGTPLPEHRKQLIGPLPENEKRQVAMPEKRIPADTTFKRKPQKVSRPVEKPETRTVAPNVTPEEAPVILPDNSTSEPVSAPVHQPVPVDNSERAPIEPNKKDPENKSIFKKKKKTSDTLQ